ncbi:MAG: flagellar biosynthesis protein FlhB [Hyphomicrobiales bacterium]
MAENQTEDTEKTEEPTQKRLEDAHKKGDVPKSQEVNTWFVILGATLLVAFFSKDMATSLSAVFRAFLEGVHEMPTDGGNLRVMLRNIGGVVLGALALPFLLLMLFAIAGNVVQHKPLLTTEQIKPKLSKISPVSGWKRLFSATSLVNFAKGIAKFVIVCVIMFFIAWPERDRLDLLISAEIGSLLVIVQELAIKMLGGVIAILTVIAALDLMYQRHQWHQKQRMSMKEVRDEHKQMEGDPVVKAKLRQVRMERGRRRMMAAVPEATVVVTNPTHFAVALKYEPGMAAPLCVAKGSDNLALNIRKVAEEHDIPIVENPPLARGLHATVEIDDEIPPEHYKAVAQVISYVMRLSPRGTRRRANAT